MSDKQEIGCGYCGATFPSSVRHGCLLSAMRPDLRAEVDALIASKVQAALESAVAQARREEIQLAMDVPTTGKILYGEVWMKQAPLKKHWNERLAAITQPEGEKQ